MISKNDNTILLEYNLKIFEINFIFIFYFFFTFLFLFCLILYFLKKDKIKSYIYNNILNYSLD